jgi:hypothetical protein
MLIEGAHGDKIHEEEDGLASGVRIRSATAHISEESESVLNGPTECLGLSFVELTRLETSILLFRQTQAGCLYKPIK